MGVAQIGGETFRVVVESIRGPATTVALVAAVVVVGWYLSGLAIRFFGGNVRRAVGRESVAKVVVRAMRGAVLLGVLFVALPIVGFAPRNLLVSATVISAVIGVVLAPLAQGFVSGVFVLVNRPYEIGDMIEVVDEEKRGYVDDITLRYTRIITLDNTFLLIPNETILDRDVINYSADDERTRVSVEFTVTYEGDLKQARAASERAIEPIEGVIGGGPEIPIGGTRYPARPRAFIKEFADHGILIDLRFWVERPYLPRRMRSRVHENLWEAFEEADVDVPYPHTHLVFDETSGQARVAVERRGATTGSEPSQQAEHTAD